MSDQPSIPSEIPDAPPVKVHRLTLVARVLRVTFQVFVIYIYAFGAADLGLYGWLVAIVTGRNPAQGFIVRYTRWSTNVTEANWVAHGVATPPMVDPTTLPKPDYTIEKGKAGQVQTLYRLWLVILCILVAFSTYLALTTLLIVTVLPCAFVIGRIPKSLRVLFDQLMRYTYRVECYLLTLEARDQLSPFKGHTG
jgi:hypothetical protein